ncbi:hyalin-like [Amphiura filiformis]|uniref:hyalin-like n=1 Tax=Amphiura filiformis TaxID=82378 RepID=UPI003B21E59A
MYIFADSSNNMAYCTFSIRINLVDSLPPEVLNCPSDIRTTTEVGIDQVPVFWIEPIGIDESGRTSVIQRSHAPGQLFAIELTQVSYLFSDDADNRAFCNFSVTVNQKDTISPEIVGCPSDIYKTVEIGTSPIYVSWDEPVASDISGYAELFRATHKPGEEFDVGSTLVSYTYMDGSNNTATCRFYIQISGLDTRAPTIILCPSNVTAAIDEGSLGAIVNWEEPSAEDASGNVMLLIQTHSSGTFFTIGTTIVSYIFRDNANNMEKCSFSVTVSGADTRAPTILFCPNNVTAEIDEGSFGAIVNWKEPIAEDASGEVMLLIQTHSSGTFFAIGTTIVSYIFRDNANNMDKCSFSVTVSGVDKTSSKIFNCPSNIVARVEPGKDATTVTWSEPFAINLSAATKISSTHESNESFPIGSTQVTYTFEQPDGYKELCNFTVTVLKHENTAEVGEVRGQPNTSGTQSVASGVSYAALIMSLLILVFIICVVLMFLYIRLKTKDSDVNIQGLELSTTTSLKSLTNF